MSANPYLIGIAGPSGAGKSYLAHHLADALHAPVLALDHYYRDLSHLPPEERALSNFDEPLALEHTLLVEQVAELGRGRAIELPIYDFAIHTRAAGTQAFQPAAYILVEGLFTLYWPELRALLGTAVYVEMENGTCLQRRIERDTRERGRTRDSVVWQFNTTVAPMAERYVRPTQQFADVSLTGDTPITEGVARVMEHIRQTESLRGSAGRVPSAGSDSAFANRSDRGLP